MATTKLWHIQGRLKDLIEYVEDPAKTNDPSLQDFFNVFSDFGGWHCAHLVGGVECVVGGIELACGKLAGSLVSCFDASESDFFAAQLKGVCRRGRDTSFY